MSDEDLPEENDNKNEEHEEIDIDSLVDEVAGAKQEEGLEDEWAAAMEESGDLDNPDLHDPEPAELEELKDEGVRSAEGTPELDVILDIPVTISMEVGNTNIAIRNLLQLNQGSVIELDRLAGEPLDVLVNGTLIAHGEVVMVNEKFGIRLTDVVSQQERISRLK
ncbi:MAG: flagellar motor switch protein FliN [Saccharospirillaceae bacterium]|nr:flagellar motor switch protein FliN [Pseudomonadales bacterium]NRB77852.1 flagellar motor switch protein FliN [Saccharospirillaceae bacterium]